MTIPFIVVSSGLSRRSIHEHLHGNVRLRFLALIIGFRELNFAAYHTVNRGADHNDSFDCHSGNVLERSWITTRLRIAVWAGLVWTRCD
jgi:hypothetical protein